MKVLNLILDHLFGRKYYANIIITVGTDIIELTSAIHRTREQADAHRAQIDSTLSYRYITTITFRTKAI